MVGVLSTGAGPTVPTRADEDALPVREDTGCRASRAPRGPEIEVYDIYPWTDNDPGLTRTVTRAFGVPYTYWALTHPGA